MGALIALARQGITGIGFGGARRILTGPAAIGGAAGSIAGFGLPDFGFGGGGDGRPRRRRRRKMFTDTDLAQFAAAEAIGGKKTAAALMMIRAAKA